MTPRCRRVAVLGAGVSGLAAIKTCLEEGLDVVAYESRPCVGGVWSKTKDEWAVDGPSMYSSLVTNTSKSMTCFSDFPCPADYPPYLPHRLYSKYIQSYADHFRLCQHIRFNTRVVSIVRTEDHEITGQWCVTIVNKEGEKNTYNFDGIIICAGFYSKAWTPSIPGLTERFLGHVLHSSSYENSHPFCDKTVLVVGNASSAGDIACDVSSVAKQVYLSVGNGCSILGRISSSCLPADFAIRRVYNELMSPSTIIKKFIQMANKKFDHRTSGLLYTGPEVTDTPFLVSDEIPVRILTGKVKIIPFVSAFLEKSIETIDGKVFDNIDVVIFATGYERNLSMLDKSLNCGGEKLQLYKMIFPVEEKHHTLALVGCIRAIGPMPPTLELQARMAVYTLSGRHKLPSREVMRRDVEELNNMGRNANGSYKYSYLGLFIADNIAAEINVKPKFWKLFFSGKFKLAFACFFGPALPFHYRLMGPGVWSGAELAISRAVPENLQSLRHRAVGPTNRNPSVASRIVKASFVLFFIYASASYFLDLSYVKSTAQDLCRKLIRFIPWNKNKTM